MTTGPLPSHIEDFLQAPHPAVMGTVRPDGSPATTATWYDWIDGHLLLSVVRTSPRARNLRTNPRVSLTILDSDWYHHVTLYGTVVQFRDDAQLADLDRMSLRYYGTTYPKRGLDCVTAIVRVDRWHAWGNPGRTDADAPANAGR